VAFLSLGDRLFVAEVCISSVQYIQRWQI